MLREAFEDRIQIKEGIKDWKEAVQVVMKPMKEQGFIKPEYVDAIYESVKKNGDYFILMPGFAMPHARPECGAVKTGLSFLKLKKPVTFSSGQEVSILVGLAAKDSDSHLDLMSELTELLIDEDKVQKIYQAESEREIQELL